MGTIIKAYVGLFFTVLTLVLGVSIADIGVEEYAAQDFHADVIEEIESSNFSPSVIQACIDQANEAGYELTVNSIVSDVDNNVQMAEVVMKYKYIIDIFDISTEHEKRGFAR